LHRGTAMRTETDADLRRVVWRSQRIRSIGRLFSDWTHIPSITQKAEGSGQQAQQEINNRGGDGGGEPPKIGPTIQDLLSRPLKSGEIWPETDHKLWLRLLEGSFKLIYRGHPYAPAAKGEDWGK
jgi:hypothetical protein